MRKDNRDIALTHVSSAVVLIAPEGEVALFNARMLSIFDLPAKAISIGMKWKVFISNIAPYLGWDSAVTDRMIADYAVVMQGENTARAEHHLPDGRVLLVACNPLEGGGALLTYDDITQSHRGREECDSLEAEARLSERKFKLLVEGITDYAIYLLDPNGTVLNWNAGAQRAKGYVASEIVGQNFARFYSSQDQSAGLPQKGLKTALREGRFEAEGPRYRKDGSSFWAHVVIDPIYEDDGTHFGFAKITRDRTEHNRNAEKIRYLARHDSLTGLPNRARFIERLDAVLETSRATSNQVAVVAIDLDGFKAINDTHGHAVGDLLLQQLAERMNASLTMDELVGRFGGDEFIALKTFTDPEALTGFIGRLRKALTEPISIAQRNFLPGASLGIAVYPDDAEHRDKLLDNADLAMYRAKSDPFEKACFFTPKMDEAKRSRRTMAADIWEGLEKGQFQLHYQTQRNIATSNITSYEALLRWKHPIHGWISPSTFIKVAEECGAIVPLGEWVLRTACKDGISRNLPRVSVNISPVQLGSDVILQTVKDVLSESGLPPHRLELEVTESSLISDRAKALRILSSLKALDVGIAIDDFGTGYSSLETLRSFPFDRLKLDRSFTNGLESDPKARAFVTAMITLGCSLDLHVLAEGVETEGQRQFLSGAGCMEVQGFLFDEPSPIAEGEAMPSL